MPLFLISFIAGFLTVLAPCILPVLPVIISSSSDSKNKFKPYFIIFGLSFSILLFTILLKASTLFLNIDPNTWKIISGLILFFFGLSYIFPNTWDKISAKLNLTTKADRLLEKASSKSGYLGDILVGASLGPVFTSCSPTYSLIIATILPVNFISGMYYIAVYVLGLVVAMTGIAFVGQKLTKKLKIFANPNGFFKKFLGIILVLVSVFIVTGLDKKLGLGILENGFVDITKIEQNLLLSDKNQNSKKLIPSDQSKTAPEFTGLDNWINSQPLKLADLKGKIVLVDFWTYSCINCQRTFPHLRYLNDKYKDKGLVIVGVHAPEFAFEKKPENVQKAVKDFDLNYPIALDNDFKTWKAFDNQFWPAKYLIDKDGKIRYQHFGEGGYQETENVIQELLNLEVKPEPGINMEKIEYEKLTPETYLGWSRSTNFKNQSELAGKENKPIDFTKSKDLEINQWTLDGKFTVYNEHIVSESENSFLEIRFSGKNVYLVAGSQISKELEITSDSDLARGLEKKTGFDSKNTGHITVNQETLYHLIQNSEIKPDSYLRIKVPKGVKLNVFTFG